jgi:single-strand DNA-binding protein
MSGLNQVNLIGRLGKDPIIRTLPDGGAVANMSLAINKSFKTADGTTVEKVEWVNIVTFGKLAEVCGDHLKKGRLVFGSGELRTRDWTDKDGIKRYSTEVVCNTIRFLDTKKAESAPEAMADDTQSVNLDDVPF